LFAQVQQLLAMDKEFVLKYKDNEGDLITLASNEELACALNYSEGNILRLVAQPKDAPVPTESDVPVCSGGPMYGGFHGCGRRGRGGRFHGHGRGYGHFPGYGSPQGGPMDGGCGSDMFKAKWQSKIDYFKSQLSELEKVPEKTPEQQQEVLRLQKKLTKFESILEGRWEKKGRHGAKWEDKQGAKWEKKNHKMEKRMRKKEKKEQATRPTALRGDSNPNRNDEVANRYAQTPYEGS